MKPKFFVGLHKPHWCYQFARSMVSVNVLENRRSDFQPHDWILDSGAFSRIGSGRGHMTVDKYAHQIERWSKCGNLVAAVTQDWMCEPFILTVTGLTVVEHQRLTTERYQELLQRLPDSIYLMPVLQGYTPTEYTNHLDQYGALLPLGAWVGVGSICKRNSNPHQVERVLSNIKQSRPDLLLHGFGLKYTALASPMVNHLLYSCDSMAWSWAARREGRNPNNPDDAMKYCLKVQAQPVQGILL